MASSRSRGNPVQGTQRGLGATVQSLPRFMLQPRWKKMLADLWSNKTRTLLVVLSIFIGVFAVGMIANSQHVLTEQLRADYLRTNPANLSVSIGVTSYNTDFTIDTPPSSLKGFDQDLVETIRHMPEVADAEGRRVFNAQVQTGPNKWQTIQFIAVDDYDDMRVNTIQHMRGVWPPDDHQVLIERSSLRGPSALGAQVGEYILIELSDGKQRRMPIVGVAHDIHQWPTPFIGTIYAYINMDTLAWLGEPHEFNQIHVLVAHNSDSQEHNEAVAQQVYDKIQKAGLEPSFPQVPEPGKHPLEFIITSLTALMGILSLMAIVLSGFLVFNTISALLAQQVKQIGIMKAVGARSRQIIILYLLLVMCFGVLALLPAVPMARFATGAFAAMIADFLNFTIEKIETPVHVVLLQAAISLVVPVLGALVPVVAGTRITVREALDSTGVSASYGTSLIDRLMRRVRGLPRPVLLSLRNTFRRKGRVALTLITLTMGGAIFVSIFSIQDSLWRTIDEFTHNLYRFDVEVYLERPYRAEYLVSRAESVPGVAIAEPQVQTTARRVFTGDREGQKIQLFAVPPDTRTMSPPVREGRWLLPEDENAIVISTGVIDDDPGLSVGDEMMLKIQDEERIWRIVGVVPVIGGYSWAYVSYDYYGEVTKEVGEASYLRVIGEQHSPAEQLRLAAALEEHFKRLGINVNSTKTMAELSEGDRQSIELIVVSLMFMAMLVAVVGGLGLAGTMSLNVIERVREIGIMRSIGASDTSVVQIFMVEGVLIGMLSWLLAALAALPISKLMSNGLGMLLFSDPLTFSFSFDGIVIWLIISVVLAAVASFLPAWNATRVSVREVLSYE